MKLAGNSSYKSRSCSIAACLLIMLAMLASAVSACACTHHRALPAVEQERSCHPATHEETAASPAESAVSDDFRSGCSCFINAPVPAMAAKSESKKFSPEKAVAAVETFSSKVPVLHFSRPAPADLEFAAFSDSGVFPTSGPARAPPRP